MNNEDFIPFMTALISENSEISGHKLHITEWLWYVNEKRLGMTDFVKFMLENFDFSKMNKGKIMKEIILRDDTAGLEAAAENGWLKLPKKRDEMIAFATENKKTECTAWLLDFKNRTADFQAERERAEKRERRELNADPNSATALKKIWSWKIRDDGTLVITGYKGDKTRITVPSKIGKDTVTAIGEYAFSPDAKRIYAEQRALRNAITEVVLPDTVTEIGEFAFFKCRSLKSVRLSEKLTEIPKAMLDLTGIETFEIGGSVKKIGGGAFYACQQLRTVILREGVEEIDNTAFIYCTALETVELPVSIKKMELDEHFTPFTGCGILTVKLHKGSYAERYCTENNIPFKYKE